MDAYKCLTKIMLFAIVNVLVKIFTNFLEFPPVL